MLDSLPMARIAVETAWSPLGMLRELRCSRAEIEQGQAERRMSATTCFGDGAD